MYYQQFCMKERESKRMIINFCYPRRQSANFSSALKEKKKKNTAPTMEIK